MAIKKKFISGSPAEAIDGSKLLFSNDEAFRVKNASGVAEEIFKYDSSNVLKLLKVPQVAADPSAADDLVRKSFLDGQVTTLNSAISAEQSAREAAISAEAAAREAADEALDGRLDILEPKVETLEGEMDAVEGRLDVVEPKVSTLESEMDAVEGRATALEGRATDLETEVGVLKGNSTVEGSVDFKVAAAVNQLLDGAPEAYDTLKEIADYIASDEGAGTALVGRVGVLEGQVETLEGGVEVVGSVAYSVEQEKTRAMGVESDLQSAIDGEISERESEITRVEGLITSEESARVSGDNALDARLDIIEGSGEGSVAKALVDAKAYTDSEISTEAAARVSGDEALDARLDVLEGSGEGSVAKALVDAKAYTDQEISTLNSALDSRLDELELDSVKKEYVDTQDAATLASAEGYTDGEITAIKGGVSESYNTLKKIEDKIGFIMSNVDGAAIDSLTEIVAAFQGADSDINTAISDLASTAGTNLASEQARAEAAEEALGERIDSVEADLASESAARIAGDASVLVDAKDYTDAQLDTLVIQQQQYTAKTLASGDITAQYVDVSGPIQGTPWVMIDGVMGRPGVDFTHSGSRITFAGEWATSGESALASGDVLHIFFMKNYSPFV